jgi:hypothetical protein
MAAEIRTASACLIILISLYFSPCLADEILFQNQKALQTGVVVDEDLQSVTIRFPREEIQSITGSGDKSASPASDKVIWREEKDYVVLKIPRSSILLAMPQQGQGILAASPDLYRSNDREINSEVTSGNIAESGSSEISMPQIDQNGQQKLLREETGSVEGIILWQGKPLQNSKVKIVLEKYTGFSVAALKKRYAEKDASFKGEIALESMTDSKGRYAINDAPPGFYRLYWKPDRGTEWIHRLRETPDFEVISGNLTAEDVPGKKK